MFTFRLWKRLIIQFTIIVLTLYIVKYSIEAVDGEADKLTIVVATMMVLFLLKAIKQALHEIIYNLGKRKEFKQIETINESIATRNDAIVTLNETILSGELKQFAGALIKQRNI